MEEVERGASPRLFVAAFHCCSFLCIAALRTFENEMSVPNDKISKMLAVFKVKEFCVLVRRRRVVFFCGSARSLSL